MTDQNHEKIPVKRHRLPGVDSYDVTSDELDQIEHETSQVGLDLSFAGVSLTAFISFLIALLTANIQSDRIYCAFIAIEIATGALALYFSIKWYRGRRRRTSIIARIRCREIGPLGDEKQEIRASELEELPSKEPENVKGNS
jgi:hypothetical protein